MSPLARTLEALLFLSPEPVALADLAQAADVWPDEAESALTPRIRVISGRDTGCR